jgi:hypothetical protein
LPFDIDIIFSMAIARTHAAVPYAKPGRTFFTFACLVNSAVCGVVVGGWARWGRDKVPVPQSGDNQVSPSARS